jgi:hypothetical protein
MSFVRRQKPSPRPKIRRVRYDRYRYAPTRNTSRGNNRIPLCSFSVTEEAMTKDEIIESWWPEGSGHSAYSSGACDGASKMYDHRQKEIDEAYDAGWKDSARATQSYALGEMKALFGLSG